MPNRETKFAIEEIYHIFSKSIAGFNIFNNDSEFQRMEDTIKYYKISRNNMKFSKTKELDVKIMKKEVSEPKKLIEIICYCLMPTHIHLVLKQLIDDGISDFVRYILNSYSRYFNIKHNRKGPLWEGRFKDVHVKDDEQLAHLTRYVHLNPVTSYLIDKPEQWQWSSYKEYITGIEDTCVYKNILDITPDGYKKFVEDRISYQRELNSIKHLLLE